MNGVVVPRHGLMFEHNEATGSGKVFKYIPGLRDTITNSKTPSQFPQNKKQITIILMFPTIPKLGWRHGQSPEKETVMDETVQSISQMWLHPLTNSLGS